MLGDIFTGKAQGFEAFRIGFDLNFESTAFGANLVALGFEGLNLFGLCMAFSPRFPAGLQFGQDRVCLLQLLRVRVDGHLQVCTGAFDFSLEVSNAALGAFSVFAQGFPFAVLFSGAVQCLNLCLNALAICQQGFGFAQLGLRLLNTHFPFAQAALHFVTLVRDFLIEFCGALFERPQRVEFFLPVCVFSLQGAVFLNCARDLVAPVEDCAVGRHVFLNAFALGLSFPHFRFDARYIRLQGVALGFMAFALGAYFLQGFAPILRAFQVAFSFAALGLDPIALRHKFAAFFYRLRDVVLFRLGGCERDLALACALSRPG